MAENNSNKSYRENVEQASRIFSEYGDFIYSIIFTKVKNIEKTEDIAQNFFLSLVYKPIPPDVKDIKRFIYRAVTNDIIDTKRGINSYTKNFQKYSKNLKFPINNPPPANAYIDEGQIFEMLDMMKERLPGSCYQAINLRYKENQSIKDIAEQMGVERASVSRYLSIGLKKLRRLWALK